jgi:hypothetical protein
MSDQSKSSFEKQKKKKKKKKFLQNFTLSEKVIKISDAHPNQGT